MRTYVLLLLSLISVSVIAEPCDTPEHRQFDFWLGNWNVTSPEGKPAGKNSITVQQNGCLLKENWTSANQGFTGTSYSFYHTKKQQWQQLWIDNGGGVLELTGNLEGKNMVLKSAPDSNKDDKEYYHQISWTPNADGSVRQFWQTFVEDKEPAVVFDGLYKKE